MLSIADLSFDSPFVLAPLAGYTDLPFRLLCRAAGAGYCVTEMISCHGLVYRQPNTLRMLRTVDEERPFVVQLFGAEVEMMAEAAAVACEFGADMIDINMGCPVRKVTRKGAGAALMKTPQLAAEIISAVVRRVDVPVTVKMRLGPDSSKINVLSFALMAEECGAAAVTVHGRTLAQGFCGRSDNSWPRRIRERVTIPVIGNGDITSREEGRSLMRRTGCDGVMIGRAALGRPWIFTDSPEPESIAAVGSYARRHLQLIEEYLPADRVLGYVKNQMCRYFKGLPGSSSWRRKIFAAGDLAAVRSILLETTAPGSRRETIFSTF